MSQYLAGYWVVISLLLCGCAAGKPKQVNPPLDASLERLSFIIGCYSQEKDGITTAEHWISPGGKTMLGIGTTVKSGQTVFFEFLRIESRDDGIYYIPQPKGSPPTLFRLAEVRDGMVVFENPQHDFPSRIVYERIDAATLKARIEGTRKGQPAMEEWVYRRM